VLFLCRHRHLFTSKSKDITVFAVSDHRITGFTVFENIFTTSSTWFCFFRKYCPDSTHGLFVDFTHRFGTCPSFPGIYGSRLYTSRCIFALLDERSYLTIVFLTTLHLVEGDFWVFCPSRKTLRRHRKIVAQNSDKCKYSSEICFFSYILKIISKTPIIDRETISQYNIKK